MLERGLNLLTQPAYVLVANSKGGPNDQYDQ